MGGGLIIIMVGLLLLLLFIVIYCYCCYYCYYSCVVTATALWPWLCRTVQAAKLKAGDSLLCVRDQHGIGNPSRGVGTTTFAHAAEVVKQVELVYAASHYHVTKEFVVTRKC